MEFHIGTSGWHYDHWKGVFYPEGLAKSAWLGYYAEHFSSVELNNSFYRLPSEKAFTGWKDSTPDEFVFSVKASRYITHIKRLKGMAGSVSSLMERAELLGDKLGPVLYQLPKGMKQDCRVLEDFLKILPTGTKNVFEFRDDSWLDEKVYELMRHYNAGFCIYNMPDFTTPVIATSDFAYVRFHGSNQLYSSDYSENELEYWAGKISDLKVKTVYAYFNNDIGGFAPKNAQMLRTLLEGNPT